jgi:chromatin segregation and condensation protein Rec8/ScpA/Scc1 (kleisin family)
LAILELIRQGRVTYEQDAPNDELQLIAPSLVPESYAS